MNVPWPMTCDHCPLRALVGREDRDRPSLLGTLEGGGLRGPRELPWDEKSTWLPTWQTTDECSMVYNL